MNEFTSPQPKSSDTSAQTFIAFKRQMSGVNWDDPTKPEAKTDGWDTGSHIATPEAMHSDIPLGHIAFMGDFDQPQG